MKRGINRGGLGKRLICSGSERAAAGFSIIDDPMNPWYRSFRGKLSRVEIISYSCQDAMSSFALFSAELEQRHKTAALRRRAGCGHFRTVGTSNP
jgi:hypothetical protein